MVKAEEHQRRQTYNCYDRHLSSRILLCWKVDEKQTCLWKLVGEKAEVGVQGLVCVKEVGKDDHGEFVAVLYMCG